MDRVKAGLTLASGLALTDLDLQELWGRYVTRGGVHSRLELALYMSGEVAWTVTQHDIVAQALNEVTSRQGLDHPVPYAKEMEPQVDKQ